MRVNHKANYPASRRMLVGLGNLAELKDADSVGIDALMAGMATESRIDCGLTVR